MTAQTVIDAMRLAIVGAASKETALLVVEALLNRAPTSKPHDLESTRLLFDTIRELGLVVADPSTD